MVNSGMFISVAFLSIVASVAAFGFLITQLIFMCFGRSGKKKRAKQKTVIKNDINDNGEASGIRLNRVDGDRVNDGNLGVDCDKAPGINSDCGLRIDGDEDRCDKQVKNYSVIESENVITIDTPCDGENATGNDKGGDGGDGGNDDGDDDGNDDGDDDRNDDGSRIESKKSGKNGRDDVGDDGGDGVSDDGGKIDSKRSGNNGRDDGGGEADNDGGVGDSGGKDDDGGDASVSDDGNKIDSKRSGDKGRDDGGGEGDDEDDSNDGNKIDSKRSGNNIGDHGGHDDDDDGVSDDGSKIDSRGDGDDGFVCGNNICVNDGAVNGGDDYERSNDNEGGGDNGGGVDGDYGSRHDIKNGDGLDVADMNLNIDGEQGTVIDDRTETRDKDDGNNMHKCCSFKYKKIAAGESDLMHTSNCCETSNGTHGKTIPRSCNQCACQCSHIGINGSNGQATHRDHDALHIKKQRIQFKLDVDITKYQIDDGNEKHSKTSTSRNFGERFSDGEVIDNYYVQNDLVNQTRNMVSSFWPENALCDNVSPREITSKCKNRSCCSNVQQNMIKYENSVKFYSGRQIVREKTISNTNDNEYLIKDTTDTSPDNCGLILDDNFNEDEPPFGLKKISAEEPKTRDIAIQVFEGCTSYSGRNSPSVFDGIGNSTRNSSTISCCCSSEYEYGREMDSVSSSDSSESLHFDENICAREFSAREHSINMDCVENNFGHESEKKFGREDAANSSIVGRFLSGVVNFAECCISALNGSAQNE
ncbi:Hypothetical predicted protein [Paramuricea clavata]|uniref:Uncharacterized protein n=1 Tax=Paramuricea clavata TaxID=317549 RepID=A0A7D9DHJ6_PARCT|nr:Hypothetical predicted protein [Paramuricea clavata]